MYAPGILFLLGALWGGSFTLSKIATQAGVPPLGYAFWQVGGAAAVILVIVFARKLRLVWRGHFRFYLVTGICGVAAPLSALYLAIEHIPAGLAAIVATSVPIFTYVMSAGLKIEQIKPAKIVGVGLGFVGVLVMVMPETRLPTQGMLPWVFVALLMPVFYAFGTTWTGRHRPHDIPALSLTAAMLLIALVSLLAVTLLDRSFYVPSLRPGPAEIALLGQVAIASVGYVLFFELIRVAGPLYFSLVGYLVTGTGLFYASWLLDETYSAWIWVGGGVLLVGVAMVNGFPRLTLPSRLKTQSA